MCPRLARKRNLGTVTRWVCDKHYSLLKCYDIVPDESSVSFTRASEFLSNC